SHPRRATSDGVSASRRLAGLSGTGLDHQHLGGTDDALTDPVAGPGDDLDRGHRDLGVLADDAELLVPGRVEGISDLPEAEQARAGDGPLELLDDGLEAALDVARTAGQIDRVEHLDAQG